MFTYIFISGLIQLQHLKKFLEDKRNQRFIGSVVSEKGWKQTVPSGWKLFMRKT